LASQNEFVIITETLPFSPASGQPSTILTFAGGSLPPLRQEPVRPMAVEQRHQAAGEGQSAVAPLSLIAVQSQNLRCGVMAGGLQHPILAID